MMTPELQTEGAAIARRLARVNRTRAEIVEAATDYTRRAHAAGVSESELARLLSVDRARTIRRWLRK